MAIKNTKKRITITLTKSVCKDLEDLCNLYELTESQVISILIGADALKQNVIKLEKRI